MQLVDWLQNGTYEQGVRLYEQHGGNSFLKKRFANGPDEYNVSIEMTHVLKSEYFHEK